MACYNSPVGNFDSYGFPVGLRADAARAFGYQASDIVYWSVPAWTTRTVLLSRADSIRGACVDDAAQRIFWTQALGPTPLMRSEFDGTSITTISADIATTNQISYHPLRDSIFVVNNAGTALLEINKGTGAATTVLTFSGYTSFCRPVITADGGIWIYGSSNTLHRITPGTWVDTSTSGYANFNVPVAYCNQPAVFGFSTTTAKLWTYSGGSISNATAPCGTPPANMREIHLADFTNVWYCDTQSGFLNAYSAICVVATAKWYVQEIKRKVLVG